MPPLDLRKLQIRAEDCWPLCPVCGEDELADLSLEHMKGAPANASRELFCYRCARVTVEPGQAWPICAKCDKGVELYERLDDPVTDIIRLRLYCHGEVQQQLVDRRDGAVAKTVHWGKAFSDGPPLIVM